ncbi:UDP-N-acetylmuramoyl-tripeptide--D-alanyl-D-alanine ligase [Macrococcoides canis]|uniref:UDP-N-acetylmuramoyl-tripeptide--D-alanyl-D-alanine ligase n=1 Tax=Macrococcoides canis TaxID=1855823 RepID=A0A1W7AE89_9STAP|nr:Mur ligase family protein [Macrococcus canis]ARQ07908.1 UDP-N-acetylmuramoyl-tripeptide--D-alanyl-D-alanine ligase [Macrococcus canis]UJS27596.1 hypothetical protein L2Z53_10745 [Macrococcus canis]
MFNIESLHYLLNGRLVDGENKRNHLINDFEYNINYVKNKNTAFISIKNRTWEKFHGRKSKIIDGNEQINSQIENIGLIITEEYIPNLKYKIPQIIVRDSIEAMKEIGAKARLNYKNPLIAITGSMGKSSTRLMLEKTLEDFNVLANRNNSNTRPVIMLNMCKLATNPDFALFEVSINAINNRGNMSLNLSPDVAIITGIGAAHLSTIPTTQEVAKYKARLLDGLNSESAAIINTDTEHSQFLLERAKSNTDKVYKYSLNGTENLKINKLIYKKGVSEINASNQKNEEISYKLETLSEGMVSNSLAVLLTLQILNLDIPNLIMKLTDFNPFNKVLEVKEFHNSRGNVTVIDDTHNASLPAMINAISAFDSQTKYYQGNKIIALGQISDLGKREEQIHLKLLERLGSSNADIILLMDSPYRNIYQNINNKKVEWFEGKNELLTRLLTLANDDSLILLKSSVTNTKFPEIAKELPDELAKI